MELKLYWGEPCRIPSWKCKRRKSNLMNNNFPSFCLTFLIPRPSQWPYPNESFQKRKLLQKPHFKSNVLVADVVNNLSTHSGNWLFQIIYQNSISNPQKGLTETWEMKDSDETTNIWFVCQMTFLHFGYCLMWNDSGNPSNQLTSSNARHLCVRIFLPPRKEFLLFRK